MSIWAVEYPCGPRERLPPFVEPTLPTNMDVEWTMCGNRFVRPMYTIAHVLCLDPQVLHGSNAPMTWRYSF